jgi:hypothetical protein
VPVASDFVLDLDPELADWFHVHWVVLAGWRLDPGDLGLA